MLGFGAVAAIMPMSSTVPVLAVFSALASAFSAVVGAMIFGLLAMDVPPAQRSATLNLVMLPLYLAGIVGPAIGAVVVTAGLPAVFLLAGVIGMLGALFVLMRLQRPAMEPIAELNRGMISNHRTIWIRGAGQFLNGKKRPAIMKPCRVSCIASKSRQKSSSSTRRREPSLIAAVVFTPN